MKNFFNTFILAVLVLNISMFAQTLTVTEGASTLDGVISSGEYSSTPLVTPLGVTLYAMDDGDYFYMAATWADDTENFAKKQWLFDGSTWTQSGNEDRVAFIFDMGLNGADGPSCMTMCHGDNMMRTNNGKVDVWHWKAARGNPMGFADDKYFNEVIGADGGRHGDAGTSTYSDNGPDVNSLPEFMAVNDPGANVDFLVNTASLSNFDPYGVISGSFAESTTFDPAGFSNSNVIPGYVLRTAVGDRGDVSAAGKWDNGVWTVEFKRANAGSDNDFTVPFGGSVDFVHEIFDNTGGGHPNDGFDGTVDTLDFSSITAVEGEDQLPQSYSLNQNYPNPFNPSTTIEYSLPIQSDVTITIYDALGNELEVLFNGNQSAGTHSLNWNASNYASGIYFYQMKSGSFNQIKKMLLLK